AFYCASVTRCYPGKAPSGRGDRTPSPREQELCAFWRDWELKLIEPALIVPVGGLAARRLLGVTSVTESVGRKYPYGNAVAIPLPHPSGASGWLNSPANRRLVEKAARQIRVEPAPLGSAWQPSRRVACSPENSANRSLRWGAGAGSRPRFRMGISARPTR